MEGYTLIVHWPPALNRSTLNIRKYEKSNPTREHSCVKIHTQDCARIPAAKASALLCQTRCFCAGTLPSSIRSWQHAVQVFLWQGARRETARRDCGLSRLTRVSEINARAQRLDAADSRAYSRMRDQDRFSAILPINHRGNADGATSDRPTSCASAWSPPPSAPGRRWSRPKARRSAGHRCRAAPLTSRKRS